MTIGDNCSLVLGKQSRGVIDNYKTLRLEGAKGSAANKLVLHAGENVGAFFIDGVKQAKGEYDSKSHPDIIGGVGKLTNRGVK